MANTRVLRTSAAHGYGDGDKRRLRLEAAVGLTVQKAVGAVLVLTVVLVLVRPHDSNIDYRSMSVVLGLMAGIVAAAVLTAVARWAPARRLRTACSGVAGRARMAVGSASSIAGGLVGLLLALPIRYRYGWDARVVTGFSRELTNQGVLSAYAHDYLSRHPNNLPLLDIMNTAEPSVDRRTRACTTPTSPSTRSAFPWRCCSPSRWSGCCVAPRLRWSPRV